jgi:hypothetical protein
LRRPKPGARRRSTLGLAVGKRQVPFPDSDEVGSVKRRWTHGGPGPFLERVVYDDGRSGNDEVFFPEADDGSGGGCQGKVPGAFAYRVSARDSSLNSFLIRSKKPNPLLLLAVGT